MTKNGHKEMSKLAYNCAQDGRDQEHGVARAGLAAVGHPDRRVIVGAIVGELANIPVCDGRAMKSGRDFPHKKDKGDSD